VSLSFFFLLHRLDCVPGQSVKVQRSLEYRIFSHLRDASLCNPDAKMLMSSSWGFHNTSSVQRAVYSLAGAQ
jgi:hypothetical protein